MNRYKNQILCKFALCTLLMLPISSIAQREVRTDVEKGTTSFNYPFTKTISFYYDDNDNKVLHGKQTHSVDYNQNGIIRKEKKIETYKDGILDGSYSSTRYFKRHNEVQWNYKTKTTNDILEEMSLTGTYKEGNRHGVWKYSYKELEQNPFAPKDVKGNFTFTFDNGKLVKFSDNTVSYTLDSSEVFEGTIKIDNKIFTLKEGVVTNYFIRLNGDYDKVDVETSEIINNYIKTKDFSTLVGTRYRFSTWKWYKPYGNLSECYCEITLPPINITYTILEKINYTSFDKIKDIIGNMRKLPKVEDVKKYHEIEIYDRYEEKYTYYYINSNEVDSVVNYIHEVKNIREENIRIAEEKRKEQERIAEEKRKEQERIAKEKEIRKQRILKLVDSIQTENAKNMSIMTIETKDSYGRTQNSVRLSYIKIYESYAIICNELKIANVAGYKKMNMDLTNKEIEELENLSKFISSFRYNIIEKNAKNILSKNEEEIAKQAKECCKDVAKSYSKEFKNIEFTNSFKSLDEYNRYIQMIDNALLTQKQCLNFIKQRQSINNTDISMKEDVSSLKHLKKEYEAYKKTFDMSWTVDTACFGRLKTFEQYQTDCKKNIELNKNISENDAIILKSSKKFKHIKKAYLKCKKSFNLLAVPNKGGNQCLEDFVVFQQKVISKIKESGTDINSKLSDIKDENKIKEIFQ